MKIAVITKDACHRCADLKNYLTVMKVPFEEWDLNAEKVKNVLLTDPNFTQNFCEEDSCTVHTPVVYDLDEKKYYSRELFGTSGLRKKFVDRWIAKN
jgi:hypothetical protein